MPEYKPDHDGSCRNCGASILAHRCPAALGGDDHPTQREVFAGTMALAAALDRHRVQSCRLLRVLWVCAALLAFGLGGWIISRYG